MNSDESLVVVAIDGPAGSGKSTVARLVADRLELEYLDTGAMYRAVTFAAMNADCDLDDAAAVGAVASALALEMQPSGEVVVNGHDATTAIRGPEVTAAVSTVAAHPDVRAELVGRQREWARERGGGVLEGRDIGSVVFPDAVAKIYLTASEEVRAARRAGEEGATDRDAVAADLARRDALDSQRTADPLRQADDAIEIDTSHLSIDEVVALIEELVGRARGL